MEYKVYTSGFIKHSVEVAISTLNLDELKSLLVEDNLEVIVSTIRLLNNVVEV